MSGYQPKIGDRVRVVLEGEVQRLFGSGSFLVGGNCIYPTDDHVFSVEKVAPPLPTTPGSVVRQDGCYLVLSTSGRWGCPDHGGWNYPAPGCEAYEVIFDAGEVTP